MSAVCPHFLPSTFDPQVDSALVTAFLRWALLRAAFARGWWLATGLYLVVVADLSASELVIIGVFQGATVLVAEVPAGVVADAVSRRFALVVAHVVMGAGMAMTGFVTAFPLLVVSNCLWGLGWAFSSGADVAWITDELDRPTVIDRVLAAQAGRDLIGTAVGILVFGSIAWATSLATAIVVAGLSMVALGAFVARWPETRFVPVDSTRRWRESSAIFRRGLNVARRERVIILVLVATLLVNGGSEGFGRLFARRLVLLGLPTDPDPIVWFAAIGLLGVALGAVTLRVVEARIAGTGVARRVYIWASAIGVVGLLVFAHSPNAASAAAGALLVSGIALPTIRVTATILVNRRTSSDVRATVHSLLSQSENAGEIVFGLALAFLAGVASSTVALTGSAALLAGAGLVVSRARA
jgi:MFS family permease